MIRCALVFVLSRYLSTLFVFITFFLACVCFVSVFDLTTCRYLELCDQSVCMPLKVHFHHEELGGHGWREEASKK